MSIFEPMTRASGAGHASESDGSLDDLFEEADLPGWSLDPRSIRIAGVVLGGIVLAGLVVTNTAQREPHPRPLAPSVQVDPGAAAVEELESTQVRRPAPVPTTSAPAAPVEISDEASIELVKDERPGKGWKSKDDKPGKGHGRD